MGEMVDAVHSTDSDPPPDPLTPKHRQFLADAAIDEKRMAGIWSVKEPTDLPKGMADYWRYADEGGAVVFPWTTVNGEVLPQLRMDNPPADKDGKKKGYRFPKGSTMVLSVPPGYQDLVMDPAIPLVIVEGTKQHLAAASALDGSSNPYAVVGISGCNGWRKDHHPIPCLQNIPLEDRIIFLAFDADVTTNRDVHDAATSLGEILTTEFLAKQIRFVLSRRGGKDGLDDILGGHLEQKRQPILLKMLEKAVVDRIPGKAPAQKPARSSSSFFDVTGNFLSVVMWDYLQDLHPMAITREVSTEKAMKGAVAVYENGVYRNGESRCFHRSITRALGNHYALGYTDLVTEIALNELTAAGRVIPDRMDQLLVNCQNGLVDVRTGKLFEHDPEVMTLFQLPVSYDPKATCPKYETWLEGQLPGQMEALEDAACQVLDRTRTAQRFLFLFGPPRSGKSTFLRILLALVGKQNSSSVTLHSLSEDRFASANLYGKVLNVAADLSSRDVKDLSSLKMLTGEDQIQGNRKYGAQFSFTSQALLAFSANDVPTVNDATGAYQERALPFHFQNQFIGKEDPRIEADILQELPGILNRFIRALQAHRLRGGYVGTDDVTRENFGRASNRVKEFLDENTRPVVRPQGTSRSILWASWKAWADENGYASGGRNGFMDKVRSCRVDEFRPKGGSLSFAVELIDPETHDEDDDGPSVDSSGGGGVDSSGPSGGKTVDQRVPLQENGSQGDRAETVDSFEDGRQFFSTPPKGHVSVRPVDVSPRPGCEKSVDHAEKCRPATPSFAEIPVAPSEFERSTVLAEKVSTPFVAPKPRALPPVDPSAASMVFDLETRSADKLFSPDGGGFVRLIGHTGADGIRTTTDPEPVLNYGGPLVAHNGFGFDFLALARHHGFDLLQAGEQGRLIDTMVLASLIRPPIGGGDGQKSMREWGLDHLGQTLLGQEKTDGLKVLEKEHGGFDQIPVDDPTFLEYCRQDVNLTQQLLEHFAPGGQLKEYAAREMRLMGRLTAGITLQGFRVDVDLVKQRIAEGERVKEEGFRWLVENHGLPTTTADGKTQAKNPAGTAGGKEAICRAFTDMGVDLPKTAKGKVSTSKEAMKTLIESKDSKPEVVRLAEVIQQLNGVRTVYQMVLDNLHGDRIHPSVFPAQASGRFSIRPGMTTFGKKGERKKEREVFLPDSDDHVLIACDLSQVDMRAIAAHCQDPAYMELFTDGRDAHSEIAAAVGLSRSDAKAIGHGWNYGMGIGGMVNRGIDRAKAEQFDAGMRRTFPRLCHWREGIRNQAGLVQMVNNGLGRRMRVDSSKTYTQAPALMGQGTARDLMAEGILRLPLEIVPMLRCFVHDELVFSVPRADVDEIEAKILDALQFDWAPTEGFTPIRILADLGARGDNWAQVYAKD